MKTSPDLALLLLHALPLDGRMWINQMGILEGRTFAPDLYRFGDTLKEWADGCLAMVPQEHIVVVGCSVGGSCALEIMHRAPERVAATILIGTKAAHNPDPDAFSQACQTVEHYGVAAAWARYWKPLFDKTGHNEAAQLAESIALEQTAEALINGLKSFHTRTSCEEVVEHSAVPIHIVSGDQDTLPGPDYAQRLAGLSKHARLHIIKDCGHYVPMMQPTPLNALIKSTLCVAKHK